MKILIPALNYLKQSYLDKNLEKIHKTMNEMPDFSIELGFKVDSQVLPIFNSLMPKDNLKIYKKGTSLRLDSTIVGFQGIKCQRGQVSFLLKGKGWENEGEMLIVNRDTKEVSNLFSCGTKKIEREIKHLIKYKENKTDYRALNF